MLSLLAIFALYWALLSFWCYRRLSHLFTKYRDTLRIPTSPNCDAFLRMDYGKWDRKALFRRCFTHFPLRMTLMVLFVVIYGLLAVLYRYVKLPGFIVDCHTNYFGSMAIKSCVKIV